MASATSPAAAKVSALGTALDHATISSPPEPASAAVDAVTATTTTASAMSTPTMKTEGEETDPPSTKKSPRKRERTDSMKRMVPLPAAQRIKQQPTGDDGTDSLSSTSPMSASSSDAAVRLPVKDRTGKAVQGMSRQHLISNAVKTAPPAKEKSNPRRWSKHEDESLRLAVERSGERNWKAIAEQVPGRNHTQCLQRWTKVLKPGLIKGHWDPEEDNKLRDLVAEGKRNWGQVASLIPGRTSKQCRERWCNHLDPNINKGTYTEEEDRIITEMQSRLGNRWSIIAQQLKGRTEDAVKIRWKSLMRGKKAASREGKDGGDDGDDDDLSSSSDSSPCTTPVVKTEEKPARTKPARAASSKQRARSTAASNARTSISESAAPVIQPQIINAHADPVSDSVALPIDSKDVAASINSYMQNIVAASLQNPRIVSGFPGNSTEQAAPPQGVPVSAIQVPPATLLSSTQVYPGNPPIYSIPSGSYSTIGVPQQAFSMQMPYPMQSNPNLPPNYVVPAAGLSCPPYPVTMQQIPTSMSGGVGPYGPYVASLTATQAEATNAIQFNGGQMYSNTIGLPPAGLAYSSAMPPTAYPVHPGVPSNPPMPYNESGAMRTDVGAMGVPTVVPSVPSKLATPRDEWGASQTPRSQLIMSEGHASAYELYHQQRLRLILKEQQRGMSLVAAPSPGQALLTKELKANKARQKRQEIMQKGWKSAVEAMMGMNNDAPMLEENDTGLLGKVDLATLDPTEDALMTPSPDIPLSTGDESVVETDNPAVIPNDA